MIFVDAVHTWCGAHSLRDLKGILDADPTGQPGEGQILDSIAAYRQRISGAGR